MPTADFLAMSVLLRKRLRKQAVMILTVVDELWKVFLGMLPAPATSPPCHIPTRKSSSSAASTDWLLVSQPCRTTPSQTLRIPYMSTVPPVYGCFGLRLRIAASFRDLCSQVAPSRSSVWDNACCLNLVDYSEILQDQGSLLSPY
ncbi:hypothetical protein O181_063881 [Austropuccinia psidii MF-1]|uniref:Uncharacterized protein n=1 Tax=Austropuccinia psidii MF-1 TaxID=1389203 RepID=A0A9Q3ESL8_9BASI|nr:hypothetical protein [Austropuccinia psidii MF-1]